MLTPECKPQATERGCDLVRAFHRGIADATSEALDEALGLPRRQPVLGIHEDEDLVRRHPGESFADLPTPYDVARGLFETLALDEDDVVFDLGCGTGRVVLYGAAVSPARFRGIEIVEERVAIAQDAIRASGLGRVTVVGGSVLDHDLSEPSVFCMARPFGDDTEARVFARLYEEARRRDVMVVTHRIRPGLLDARILEPISTGTLNIHRSRAARAAQ
jgi:SAM-dependent methyltransferase